MRGDYQDPELKYNGAGIPHPSLRRRVWRNYQQVLSNLPSDLEVSLEVSRKGVPHLTVKRPNNPLKISVTWFDHKSRRYFLVFWPYPSTYQTKAKGENGFETAKIVEKILNSPEEKEKNALAKDEKAQIERVKEMIRNVS